MADVTIVESPENSPGGEADISGRLGVRNRQIHRRVLVRTTPELSDLEKIGQGVDEFAGFKVPIQGCGVNVRKQALSLPRVRRVVCG
jgi:hypothetical protein